MILVDYVIVGVVGVSALVGILRGFFSEMLSLLSWVLAGVVALTFTPHLAALLADSIDIPSLRAAVAFIILFLAVLVLASVVGMLMNKVIKKNGFSNADRILGVLFGLSRGLVIVTVLVLLGGFTPFTSDAWWQESRLISHVEVLAVWLKSWLPEYSNLI